MICRSSDIPKIARIKAEVAMRHLSPLRDSIFGKTKTCKTAKQDRKGKTSMSSKNQDSKENINIAELEKIVGIKFEIVTMVKVKPRMITIDKAKDGRWRLIYSEGML